MSQPYSVICNAGPVIALGKLNRLDLLAAVYADAQMPEPVCGIDSARANQQFPPPPTINEADTCRLLVEPKLRDAGWETPPHAVLSQPIIAPGRIVPQRKRARRRNAQRPDSLLRYTPHLTVAATQTELDALLPAVLDRAFKGELQQLTLRAKHA